MESKRLKSYDVVVTSHNDNYEITAVRHVSSPLYVNIAKAVLLERLSRSFPELPLRVKVFELSDSHE